MTTVTEKNTLLQALLAFKAEVPALHKNAVNPHFRNRYVSLDSLTQTITPLLCKHGLVWTTLPCIADGQPALRYQLAHAPSGEAIEDVMPLLLEKQNSQGQGSALSYARRYAISSVLGLSAEDDDGNGATRPPQQAQQRPELDTEMVSRVIEAWKASRTPPDWLRMQLVSLGVENVPEGPIMQSTVRALTPTQAFKVIAACAEVSGAQAKS